MLKIIAAAGAVLTAVLVGGCSSEKKELADFKKQISSSDYNTKHLGVEPRFETDGKSMEASFPLKGCPGLEFELQRDLTGTGFRTDFKLDEVRRQGKEIKLPSMWLLGKNPKLSALVSFVNSNPKTFGCKTTVK